MFFTEGEIQLEYSASDIFGSSEICREDIAELVQSAIANEKFVPSNGEDEVVDLDV